MSLAVVLNLSVDRRQAAIKTAIMIIISGMRSVTIAVLMMLLSAPLWADEGTKGHLHYLPREFVPIGPRLSPWPADARIAFDHAAIKSMYWKSCNCLKYLEGGVVRETSLPLDDLERRRLSLSIEMGGVIPLAAPAEDY